MRCSCCSPHKVLTCIILLFLNLSFLDSPASLSPSASYAIFSFTWSLMTESKLLQGRLQSMWNGQAADVQCPQNAGYKLKFTVRCIIFVFKRVLREAINSSSENLDRLHSLRIDKLIHYSSWFIHPSIFFSQLRLTRRWDPIPAPMGRGVRLPVYHRTSTETDHLHSNSHLLHDLVSMITSKLASRADRSKDTSQRFTCIDTCTPKSAPLAVLLTEIAAKAGNVQRIINLSLSCNNWLERSQLRGTEWPHPQKHKGHIII